MSGCVFILLSLPSLPAFSFPAIPQCAAIHCKTVVASFDRSLGDFFSISEGGEGGGAGAGRENGKIWNGHIFVHTHQNCTKLSVVVYCVDI